MSTQCCRPKLLWRGAPRRLHCHQAAAFAWQEFIALNWPAMAGRRDVADTSQKFGANAGGFFGAQPRNPLVLGNAPRKGRDFQCYQDTPEVTPLRLLREDCAGSWLQHSAIVFLRNKVSAGLSWTGRACLAGWIRPSTRRPRSASLKCSRAALPSKIADLVAAAHPLRRESQSRRVRIHRGPEEPVLSPPPKKAGPPATTIKPIQSPPVAPTPPIILFPTGTVEIKSAWRPLNNYDQPTRFHVQTVRFYEKKGPNNQPCYFEQQWGLIALIIQKTPTAPAFIYATFEQADNVSGSRTQRRSGYRRQCHSADPWCRANHAGACLSGFTHGAQGNGDGRILHAAEQPSKRSQ